MSDTILGIRGSLIAALLIFTMFGCAAGPVLPPDYRARAYDHPGAAPAADPAPATSELPTGVDLDALTLKQARGLALARNHSVAAAAEAVESARARIDQARAAFLPSVGLSANHVWNQDPPMLSPDRSFATGKASLSQSIFSFGRNSSSLEAARLEAEAEMLAERSVRQDLLFETARAWFVLQDAMSAEVVIGDTLAAAGKQEQDAKALYEEERLTKDEFLTAEVNRLEQEQALVVAKNRTRQSRRALNALLALPENAKTGVSPTLPFAPFPLDAAGLKRLSLGHNPDLLRFEVLRRAIMHSRESIRRSYAPEVVGSLGIEYTETLEDEWNLFATLGVQWSLFSGGRRLGQMAELGAEARRLAEQRSQAVLDLSVAIEKAVEDVREQESAVAVARRAVTASEETYRIVYEKYLAGRETSQRVLEVQAVVANSRNGLNAARHAHGVFLAQLEALVGVSIEDWNR